jgi:hypothetical protein
MRNISNTSGRGITGISGGGNADLEFEKIFQKDYFEDVMSQN